MELLHAPTLTELRVALGDDLDGLLHLYAGTLDSQVHELREAHRHDDVARLKRSAHSLKGSSTSVGAQVLASQAGLIERLADAGDRSQLERALLELPELAERTLAVMRSGGWLPHA